MTTNKKKIAILGSGVGAITTAFALTDPQNPNHDQYDITLYQIGWRLGGKGASGRNPDNYYRIEEHGLHVWFGFYDNAFRGIKQCYKELNRAPDAPLATWQDAFKPHSYGGTAQLIDGVWEQVAFSAPVNDEVPGGGTLLDLWDYAVMAVEWMYTIFKSSRYAIQGSPTGIPEVKLATGLSHWLEKIIGSAEDVVVVTGLDILHKLTLVMKRLTPEDVPRAEAFIMTLIHNFMTWYWGKVKADIENNTSDFRERNIWIVMNFIHANIHGMLIDDLIGNGCDSINDQDYLDWLHKYAFKDDDLTYNSSMAHAIYYGLFAYEGGDIKRPNIEAGTAFRMVVRTWLTYRGAVMWKMQAGMGDTIFAPYYQVLKNRGVTFKFFHQVTGLYPSADNKTIERIEITRQVNLKESSYQPLIEVKGLPCWPSYPLYDQIADGDKLKADSIELDSSISTWPGVEKITLTQGQDFDDVVLGISIGALPIICSDLIQASPKWQNMVAHVKTVRTQALQLWLKPTTYQLGWTRMGQPVISYKANLALNTWGDMSYLIQREGWPGNHYPQSLAYFCGPMKDSDPSSETTSHITTSENTSNQDTANKDTTTTNTSPPNTAIEDIATNPIFHPDIFLAIQDVHANGLDLLQKPFGLWPHTFTPAADNDPPQFNWDLLLCPSTANEQGQERLKQQYWRANLDPTERYVLSLVGSSQYRLPANDPDEFTNLYLAGDWTQNNLNVGCVEAATISGLLAANALSHYPKREDIVGIDF